MSVSTEIWKKINWERKGLRLPAVGCRAARLLVTGLFATRLSVILGLAGQARHRSGAACNPIRAATVKGSVAAYAESGFVRLECAHGVALPGDYVLYGRGDVLWFPQPWCAPVACPSLPVRFIQAHPCQAAARVNFEIMHDSLWLC